MVELRDDITDEEFLFGEMKWVSVFMSVCLSVCLSVYGIAHFSQIEAVQERDQEI